MRELIIHIGTRKTGSTTIQRALAESADVLLKNDRVLYPQSGRATITFESSHGQHVLAWALSKTHGIEDLASWDALIKECRSSGAERALISAEDFSRFESEAIEILKQQSSVFGTVTVVLYLRNPFGFLLSAFKQQTKGRIAYSGSFEKFVRENVDRCDYGALVRDWSNVFGQNALRVRVFDFVVASGSLLDDFANICGISFKNYEKEPQLNVSPSDGVIKIVNRLNQLQKWTPGKGVHKLKRKLLRSTLNQSRLIQSLAGPIVTSESLSLIGRLCESHSFSNLEEFLSLQELEYLRVPFQEEGARSSNRSN